MSSEFLAERVKQDPRVRAIAEDSRDFDVLREQEGWRKLQRMVVKRRDTWMTQFARRLMSGEKIEPEQLSYQRGFYAGAEFVVMQPEAAFAALERAARLAWAMSLEQVEQAGYESPYVDDKEDHE